MVREMNCTTRGSATMSDWNNDTEMGGLRTVVGDGFVGLERRLARTLDQLPEAVIGKFLENADALFEEIEGIHGNGILWIGRHNPNGRFSPQAEFQSVDSLNTPKNS